MNTHIQGDFQICISVPLRQNVKRDKLAALYRQWNVTGDIDLNDLNRFRLATDSKKEATIFEFYNGDRQVSLTTQTDDFFVPKTLRDKFGVVNVIFLQKDRLLLQVNLRLNYQQIQKWKIYHWRSFRPWFKMSMLKHGKHHKILTLTCENFQVLIRPYKTCRVNS